MRMWAPCERVRMVSHEDDGRCLARALASLAVNPQPTTLGFVLARLHDTGAPVAKLIVGAVELGVLRRRSRAGEAVLPGILLHEGLQERFGGLARGKRPAALNSSIGAERGRVIGPSRHVRPVDRRPG